MGGVKSRREGVGYVLGEMLVAVEVLGEVIHGIISKINDENSHKTLTVH